MHCAFRSYGVDWHKKCIETSINVTLALVLVAPALREKRVDADVGNTFFKI